MTVIEQERTGSWQVDKIHSSAAFEVRHMAVSIFRGKFDELDASLSFFDGRPRIVGTVRVASVDVADETLKGHLQSPDFFDAERHPEISFVSTNVEQGAGDEISVEGDLTIRGHKERVTAAGTLSHVEADISGKERYGVTLATTVDRTHFGLDWNAPLPKGGVALENDVRLVVHLEFTPEA
jgi:polyisoprenoid-binding protein YceI